MEPNAVGQMLGLLSDEWTLLVIQQSLLGATRYGQFIERLPISNSVLTRRLSSLTAQGLLARHRYQEKPCRDEYLVTERSRTLWPVLVSIWEWELRWVSHHREPMPTMRHLQCGNDFSPRLVCTACGIPVAPRDVTAGWGPTGGWARSLPVTTTRRRSGTDSDQRDSPSGLFPQTMSVLGNPWACVILVAAFVGTSRFSDFRELLGVPPGSLTDRLRTFRDNGVLDAGPEYRLTPKGIAFFPVVVTALEWAQQRFAEPEGPAVIIHHSACGQPLHAKLHCDQCSELLRGSSIAAVSAG